MKVTIGKYKAGWSVTELERAYTQFRYKKYVWEMENFPIDSIDRFFTSVFNGIQAVFNKTVNQYLWNAERKEVVKLDPYDTWNMDNTLALIIVPMLEQLRANKQGAPFVDDEDVPQHLRSFNDKSNKSWETDRYWFDRWDWVLGEMIWSFKMVKDNNKYDFDYKDEKQRKEIYDKMKNGFRLFGKYYLSLWD